MNDDFKMLERIADKAAEPFDCDGSNGGKTIGCYRQEMAALITEVMWYVAAKRQEKN